MATTVKQAKSDEKNSHGNGEQAGGMLNRDNVCPVKLVRFI